jgi:hypothetical protein
MAIAMRMGIASTRGYGMTDYERHLPQRESGHIHLPRIDRSWTIGTVLASLGSLLTIIVVVVTAIRSYDAVSYATQNIPTIQADAKAAHEQQEAIRQDVAVLKIQQQNSDGRYAEILSQLANLNIKVDRLNDSKADKQLKGWTR